MPDPPKVALQSKVLIRFVGSRGNAPQRKRIFKISVIDSTTPNVVPLNQEIEKIQRSVFTDLFFFMRRELL